MGTVIGGIADPGNNNIRALIYGTRWDTASTVTYDFPDTFTDYGAYSHTTSGFFQVPLQQRTAVRLIIEGEAGVAGLSTAGTIFKYGSYEAVSGINADDGASFNAADLSVAGTDLFDGANLGTARVADFPRLDQRSDSGDVWFGNDYASYQTPLPGSYSWATHMHELGHAFGLKHGHDASHGQFFTALAADRDSLEFSVMTYRSYIGGPTTGYTNETYGYPQTLMMYDIATLQHLYGANFNTNNTNTTYTWSPTTGEMFLNGVGQGAPGDGTGGASNRVFLTIWDGGGVDTYDMSNYGSSVFIDLSPGGYSVTSGAQRVNLGNSNFARGNVFNALQYNNDPRSLIENANGGASGDTLYGNAADNRLDGRGGVDYMYAYAGNDSYYVDDAADYAYEFNGQGVDRLYSSVDYTLVAGSEIEYMYALGTSAVNLTGNGLDQSFVGNAAANVFDGRGGLDKFYGYNGDDVFIVDSSNDLVYEIANFGYDTVFALSSYSLQANQHVEAMGVAPASYGLNVALTGNGFSQSIVGGAGANLINGGGAADYMFGLGGNDTYVVDNAGDLVYEAPGGGTDTVRTTVSYVLPAGQSIERFTFNPGFAGAIDFTGNELAQTITGNGAANRIDGKGGLDIIVTGAGADTVIFSTRGAATVDQINDFDPVLDQFEIENALFTALGAAGPLPGAAFFIGAAATAPGHRLIYNAATGFLSYDPDGNGGTLQETVARLSAGLALTAADFLVI